MKYVPHPKHTRSLGAPIGWDQSKVSCGSLSIMDDVVGGQPVMRSRWEFEGYEALAVALGAAQIELGVWSNAHPPVSLVAYLVSGWYESTRMQESYQMVLDQLIEHAKASGFKLEGSKFVKDTQ